MSKPLSILLVGASGAFGRRLAQGLAREERISLTLAGRRLPLLTTLARELVPPDGDTVDCLALDRKQCDAATLEGFDLVIDAAGPFQDGGTELVAAAITAGCHYLDLADSRAFVARIADFDQAARAVNLVLLSGASTTPALSHAVLDHLTKGWRRIDTVRVAISPGNRAPRGLSVVRAILSYAGRPVRVFLDGGWGDAPGWGLTRRVEFPGLGRRLVALCETPDLDLLVARYRPKAAAEFLAGLELPLLHYGLTLASLPVRWGWIASLAPFAGTLRALALLTAPFGSDRGGMVVEARGQEPSGQAVRARWSLVADAGIGPVVPTLAALALVRRLRDGELSFHGAGPCAGHLDLSDFEPDFRRLGIHTASDTLPLLPLFARLLGPAFADLPCETRQIHSPDPVLIASGTADVTGAETRIGRLLARLFGLPVAARAVPLRVAIEAQPDGSERWVRIYPTRKMSSLMTRPDPARGTLEECFGPFRFRLAVEASPSGLALKQVAAFFLRLRLPGFLLPRVEARETAEPGRHCFDVTIGLPLVGRLVRYRGRLELTEL